MNSHLNSKSESILGNEGWKPLIAADRRRLPRFLHLKRHFNESKLVYSGVSERIKPLQLVGRGVEIKF